MMAALNDAQDVLKQYASSEKLDTRISIHAKYSVNRQGFSAWIAEHYRFRPGASVLELGCGTGSFWLDQEALIQRCSRLILTDFSSGMLKKARETLRRFPAIEYETVDIQQIPFPDRSFDAVIANMMLYHVPDLKKGLAEVKRVLKKNGVFYCATYGEHGILEYLCELFGKEEWIKQANHSFTLQNGEDQLLAFFPAVERFDYLDSLAVTDVEDLADYIASLSSMTELSALPRETVISTLRQYKIDDVLHVPKEYGMFIATVGTD